MVSPMVSNDLIGQKKNPVSTYKAKMDTTSKFINYKLNAFFLYFLRALCPPDQIDYLRTTACKAQ